MKNYLIVILGPTAIGKTGIAIKIARHFGSEIISADSRQFYKELRIGTAYPTEAELKAVTHHFVGHLSITVNYNISQFEKEVLGFLQVYFNNHTNAVLAGGSGLYIDAVCHGIDDLPDADPKIRMALLETFQKEGINSLQKKLLELDPDYYEAVDLNNPNRVIRALEVSMVTGKKFSSLRSNNPRKRDFEIIKIGLNRPRQELFDVIDKRVDLMIEKGLVEEVKNLLEFRRLNALNTVGYKEIINYLDGQWPLEKAIEKIKTNTRRYAKRQLTWFKKDPLIQWFHPDEKEKIIRFIEDCQKT